MNKKELRDSIRAKKRAMTPEEIEARSRRLGELLAGSPAYREADTIYGYLPYNQEVRTLPILEKFLREGVIDGEELDERVQHYKYGLMNL